MKSYELGKLSYRRYEGFGQTERGLTDYIVWKHELTFENLTTGETIEFEASVDEYEAQRINLARQGWRIVAQSGSGHLFGGSVSTQFQREIEGTQND